MKKSPTARSQKLARTVEGMRSRHGAQTQVKFAASKTAKKTSKHSVVRRRRTRLMSAEVAPSTVYTELPPLPRAATATEPATVTPLATGAQ